MFSSFLLLIFTKQTYIELTNKNYYKALDENKDKVFLIKIWNSWCKHSKEFAPIWDNFIETRKDNDKVIYGDIECENNKEICRKLGIKTYPQVLWVEPRFNFTKFFTDERTVDHLQVFEAKMHFYPLNFVLSYQQIEDMTKNATKFTPLFRICVEEKDDEQFFDLRNALLDANVDGDHVYVDNTCEVNNRVVVYGSDNIFSLTNYKLDDLKNFFKFINLPKVSEYDDNFHNLMTLNEENFILMMCESHVKCDFLRNLANSLNSPYRFAIFETNKKSNIKFGQFKQKNLPYIALYNPMEEKYISYDKKITEADLNLWLQDIKYHHVEWVYNASLFSELVGSTRFYMTLCAALLVIIVILLKFRPTSTVKHNKQK